MDAERWERIRLLFERYVDDPHSPRSHLEALRREEPDIAAAVSSLLRHHKNAGSFLDTPAVVSLDDAVFEPGERVGIYQVEHEAGRGGMGRVYVATDTRLNRKVCLKVVRPDLIRLPAARERLRREAQIAASIDHPAVCAVYALEEIGEHTIIVTEWVDGRTLRAMIASGPLDGDTVIKTARQLSAALSAIHACGVTHGDLKPENVIWSRRGQLKLLDFGLARVHSNRSADDLSDVLAGTLTYMAPEQINGAPADARADVFAFGIVIYECATGEHPFRAPTALATTARILEHEPPPLETASTGVPVSVTRVVDRCLRKAPDERFRTAKGIAQSLGSEVPAPPSSRTAWWRLHQVVVTLMYFGACVAAWSVKEWDRGTATRWMFIAVGVLAASNGLVRGHLLFTSRTHPDRLTSERQRSRRPIDVADLAIASLAIIGGIVVGDAHPVAAVLILALAVAIGAAALLIEPATSAGAFGDKPEH
jgi:serine/threonine protein kinase